MAAPLDGSLAFERSFNEDKMEWNTWDSYEYENDYKDVHEVNTSPDYPRLRLVHAKRKSLSTTELYQETAHLSPPRSVRRGQDLQPHRIPQVPQVL